MAGSTGKAAGDFLQFLIGGCLFAGGVFLLSNQVLVRSAVVVSGTAHPWNSWGGGVLLPWGTPGMGLLMLPLGVGVCLLFAGAHSRWANLLIWGSATALLVGVLNSVRMTLLPATLWQLTVTIVMIGSGGGLMFRSLQAYAEPPPAAAERSDGHGQPAGLDAEELRREIALLKRRLDARDSGE